MSEGRIQVHELIEGGASARDVQEIETILREFTDVNSELTSTSAEIDQCVPDELREKERELKVREKRLREKFRDCAIMSFPDGGCRVQLGSVRMTLAASKETMSVNDDALVGPLLDQMREHEGLVNERPRVDVKALKALLDQEVLKKGALVAAGLVELKQSTPAVKVNIVKTDL
jgi:hypothetical protein|tara:strand:- start:3491 stop:4012 length:522 start_codon:yes stop_codon:yes gene_type:complete